MISENERKNDVSAQKQVALDSRFAVEGDGKTKVLFIGNSITRHGPAPEIGWYGDYGMAASAKEKDYVHVAASLLEGPLGGITVGICQAADWERGFRDEGLLQAHFSEAHGFAADIVVVRIGENILPEDLPDVRPYFPKMIRHFAHKARLVVVTDSFWRNDVRDGILHDVAQAEGYTFCSIVDLEQDERNMALTEYEHRGVAGHPSDRGMQKIAERIASAILSEEEMLTR
ncbi:MAG: SGNH/GDSL hydrolase family protein [Clostridia bacterium]|nr:SGNH/GDSL hydrolase family protein [Clostridia bacterium]